jgi:prophage DNA circulation protein
LERADQLLNLTPDDESYDDILKFKAQLIKTIPSQSQHLKKLNGVTLSKDYSSLVLAYELYGDLKYESDLLERNQIEHPAFIPKETRLSILKVSENA